MLQLCRDVYHCTPSELDEQDSGTIRVHVAMLSAESKVMNMRNGGDQPMPKKPVRGAKPARPSKRGAK